MHLSEMCTNQPILTLGRKACGCHCSIGDWASENCDGAHFSPFTKEIRLRRKKRKSIIRKPCASSTVSKLSSLETRQVTKPGQPTTATASLRSARPEEQRMRSALSRVVPRLQGGRTAQAHAQASAAPGSAGVVVVLPLPRPARPLAARRSAPHRDPGRRDPVLRRSIPGPRCAPRAGERPGPWGPSSPSHSVWEGRVRGCPRGPWLPAGCGWGGARALDLGGPVALGLSLSSCKVAWLLISSGDFLVSPFERL